MFSLWHSSVNIHKLISKFSVDSDVVFMHNLSYAQFTVSYFVFHFVGICNVDMYKSTILRFFCQTIEFARNIMHTNIMYLKASIGAKITTFFRKKELVDKTEDYKIDHNLKQYL